MESDPIFSARNGALRALEEARGRRLVEEGLRACVKCDFKKPRILNFVTEKI